MQKDQLSVKYIDKPICNIVLAVARLGAVTLEIDDPDIGCCGAGSEPKIEKLSSLGIKPGMRFVVIGHDTLPALNNLFTYTPKNNFDAIWEENLYRHECAGLEFCRECPHYNEPDWIYEHCSDCGDSPVNIIGSFFVDSEGRAVFARAKYNTISGR